MEMGGTNSREVNCESARTQGGLSNINYKAAISDDAERN